MAQAADSPAVGPACATCRQKCRRCDRAQPVCRRCVTKGLVCGGYPPKFKFMGIASRGKWKGLQAPLVGGRIRRSQRETHVEDTSDSSTSPPGIYGMSIELETMIDGSYGEGEHDGGGAANTSPSDISFEGTTPSQLDEIEMNGAQDRSGTEHLLARERTELLLSYYDQHVCPVISIEQPGLNNPFRTHILPLAYEHVGLLHAVLGLSSCHIGITGRTDVSTSTEALKHRLAAIHCLGDLLADERDNLLPASFRDVVLAIINISVLHDICESGISSNGVHLRGAAYMCERLMASREAMQSRRTVFLLGSLAWLDLMRGISGAEKLSFTQEDRLKIVEASDADFEVVCGCPRDIFIILGDVISKGKLHLAGQITTDTFERMLARNERELLVWNENRDIYPSADIHWRNLADAFRHASILRILRFPDTFSRSADFPEIQESVTKILDVASEVQSISPLSKRLLLPLFMAGADSLIPHQRHYVLLRIREIQDRTGFLTTAPSLLKQVWEARAAQDKKDRSNIPWMEFTCSNHLTQQHDYLIW